MEKIERVSAADNWSLLLLDETTKSFILSCGRQSSGAQRVRVKMGQGCRVGRETAKPSCY